MNLIISNDRVVTNLVDLNSTVKPNEFSVWVEETNEVYTFYDEILSDILSNGGSWVLTNYMHLLELTFDTVPNSYKIISFQDLKNYKFTLPSSITSEQASILSGELGYLPKGARVVNTEPPEVIHITEEGNYTLEVKGYDFNDLVICTISKGNILSVTIQSPFSISIEISGLQFGETADLRLTYPSKYYVNYVLECISLPNGKTQPALEAGHPNSYSGVPFSKSEFSSYYGANKAFDDNIGTRHYASYNSSNLHYVGILLNTPSFLISFSYEGEYGSSEFKLEASNDTTDGHDGTWVDLGNYNLKKKKKVKDEKYVYKAYRLVWISPINTSWANAREIIFNVKQ